MATVRSIRGGVNEPAWNRPLSLRFRSEAPNAARPARRYHGSGSGTPGRLAPRAHHRSRQKLRCRPPCVLACRRAQRMS